MSRALHAICYFFGIAASLIGVALLCSGRWDIGFAIALILVGPGTFFFVRVYDKWDSIADSVSKDHVSQLMKEIDNQDQEQKPSN